MNDDAGNRDNRSRRKIIKLLSTLVIIMIEQKYKIRFLSGVNIILYVIDLLPRRGDDGLFSTGFVEELGGYP